MNAVKSSVNAERASLGELSRGNPFETVLGSSYPEGSKAFATTLRSHPERLTAWVCRGSFQERVLAADEGEVPRRNWGWASYPWVLGEDGALEIIEALEVLEVLEVGFYPEKSWGVEKSRLLVENLSWLPILAWAPRRKSQATACGGSQLSWLAVDEVSWSVSRFHRCGRHQGE